MFVSYVFHELGNHHKPTLKSDTPVNCAMNLSALVMLKTMNTSNSVCFSVIAYVFL